MQLVSLHIFYRTSDGYAMGNSSYSLISTTNAGNILSKKYAGGYLGKFEDSVVTSRVIG